MSKVQKVMTQPVNVIFSMLRSVSDGRSLDADVHGPQLSCTCCRRPLFSPLQKQRVSVWLYEQPTLRLEGRIAVSRVHAACVNCTALLGCSRITPAGPLARLSPHPSITRQGFDEYMNIVLDDAEEVDVKRKTRTPVGRILLKGDNITLLAPTATAE